jgi:ATP-dependent RNA helicase SUPV3L1/SUV3
MVRFDPIRRGEQPPDVVAILGPTNTGKTHRAIEEMLRHPSGIIGLPLRLLAREVYDRITARIGERAVALVTGEEKRVPPDPRYHVCTVEAMPVDREVSFLAVDEVQLCSNRERGHVFTDRLLYARGTRTTMFLGADTVAPLLTRLVPEVRIERFDRFSRLSYTGPRRVTALPPRSAVIAFSAADVVALADRLRRAHGGAAVVIGALSPRARNAQVAMYQAGEVQYIVATDAIGMGLNLDLDLVAFSSLSKWDGVKHRPLWPDEVGQIAGRAGRYRRDGRFGPLSSVGPLPDDVVDAVISHRFRPLRRLMWRNRELDYTSPEALLHSLDRAPTARIFQRPPRADDRDALATLVDDDEVIARAGSRQAVRLLWDVCCIPDYRHDDGHDHPRLLRQVFTQLVDRGGTLDDAWLEPRVHRLDRVDGDIESLLTRIAHVRTWNYVAFRGDWLDDPQGWQQRTRDIEDRLSDVLHERLSQRFVDHTAVVVLGTGFDDPEPEVSADGVVTAADQALGHLRGFEFLPTAGLPGGGDLRRAVLRLLGPELERRVERCVGADHDEFSLDEQGTVRWDGAPLARLEPGRDVLDPHVRMIQLDLVGAGARSRIQRRLQAWIRDQVEELFAPLRKAEAAALSPPGRGLVYLLEQDLGTAPREAGRDQLRELSRKDRRSLARLDVRLGTHYLYVASLLEPAQVALRSVLGGLCHTRRPLPAPPPAGAASTPVDGDVPTDLYRVMGYPQLGGRAVRVDLVERLAAELRATVRDTRRFHLPTEAIAWLGCTAEELEPMLDGLGYRRGRDDLFGRTRQRLSRRGRPGRSRP